MQFTPPFPDLSTRRLQLREIKNADAATLLEIYTNAETMQWFGSDPLTELAQAEEMIEIFAGWRRFKNPCTRWGIQKNTEDKLIGTCGLFNWNRKWDSCMVGYELAAEEQGNGFMSEALKVVLTWGFAHMDLNRIEALIHPDNAPSIKLAERLGFKREGLLRQVARWSGSYHDMLQYSLLNSDWNDWKENNKY